MASVASAVDDTVLQSLFAITLAAMSDIWSGKYCYKQRAWSYCKYRLPTENRTSSTLTCKQRQ